MNWVMKVPVRVISLVLPAVILLGCVSIPKEPYLLSQREGVERVDRKARCGEEGPGNPVVSGDFRREGIDPEGFTLFSWNTKKGGMEGWELDFATLSAGADLMTLQEVIMTDGLRRLLDDGCDQWDMSTAFLSRKRETGVLTGARTPPDQVCADKYAEPLLIIPKAVLVSRYPLADREKSLLVANVHLINFTVGVEEYLGQLQRLEETISSHDGPLLLTGDFNTWSDGRSAAVRALAGRLSLREVGFTEDHRTSFFGRTVDHVFTRGLETVDARVMRVATSDHNPLLVTFRVSEEN